MTNEPNDWLRQQQQRETDEAVAKATRGTPEPGRTPEEEQALFERQLASFPKLSAGDLHVRTEGANE